MHCNRQWQYGIGVLAFVWSLGLSLPQAQASPIGCGAILGPGGNFVLDSDVGPCGEPGPALTLISATLDLAGHTVSCSTLSIYGIEVEGKKSRVRNGTVSGCGNGVVLRDQGSHEVREVTATGNTAGFNVGSSRNKLTNNAASGNEFVGFAVGGEHNQLTGNTASGNEFGFLFQGATNGLLSSNTAMDNSSGFEMFLSSANLLTSNTASDNKSSGFEGDLNTNNRWASNTASGNGEGFSFVGHMYDAWVGNIASGNGGFGFSFGDGMINSLDDNRASGNGFSGGGGGFGIEEPDDTVVENKATDNIGAGFDLFDGASSNLLRVNQSLSNSGPGIRLNTGATGNSIRNSKALDNGSFDLEDDNLGCDANAWGSNTFGVANQGCIN
jgi:parallel beta-helix repeat protein